MLSGVSCRNSPLRNRRSPKTNGAKPRFLARSALESLKDLRGAPVEGLKISCWIEMTETAFKHLQATTQLNLKTCVSLKMGHSQMPNFGIITSNSNGTSPALQREARLACSSDWLYAMAFYAAANESRMGSSVWSGRSSSHKIFMMFMGYACVNHHETIYQIIWFNMFFLWLTEFHKPSPSHHHVDGWYRPSKMLWFERHGFVSWPLIQHSLATNMCWKMLEYSK